MTMLLTGTGVARGVVIGPARVLHGEPLEIVEYALPRHFIPDEVRRFRAAVKNAQRELQSARDRIPPGTPADIADFINTHLLMLQDEALSGAVVNLIRSHQCNAEWALKLHRDAVISVFDEMEDPYLRTRRDDINHVVNRVLRVLLKGAGHAAGTASAGAAVCVAEDLTPADVVMLRGQGVRALVTETGGPVSHTSILARSLGLATVTGLRHACKLLREAETLVVDGEKGLVLAEPDVVALRYYRQRLRTLRQQQAELRTLRRKRNVTRDGTRVRLLANVELSGDLRELKRVGAEGIGLYRTEFLYLNRDTLPDEEEQYQAYLKVIKAANGKPVTIRTLDLEPEYARGVTTEIAPGANPALGLRAVRLCLREPALFKPQLRALLRAAAHGPLRIMLPMVASVEEVRQVRVVLQVCQAELKQAGIRHKARVPLGVMIEIPSAALAAVQLAREADFLSIGTNDLIQYTLALDRSDDAVSHLHDPIHPAVLHLISHTLAAGRRARIAVGMCGEMAGDIRYTRLLLGLGLREFSMHPSTLLEVKRVITTTRLKRLSGPAKRMLHSSDAEHGHRLLLKLNELQ